MLTTASEIETPLGNLTVDNEAQKELNKKVSSFRILLRIEYLWFL